MGNAGSHGSSGAPGAAPVGALEQALHAARALVLADLTAGGVAEADVVSMVEESVVHRRWWVGQWPEGVGFVTGLVAQDVQDAFFERYGRWPVCPVCRDDDPHALDVRPELGADPHWVCPETGVQVAAVGGLRRVPGHGSGGPGAAGGREAGGMRRIGGAPGGAGAGGAGEDGGHGDGADDHRAGGDSGGPLA